MRISDWSSDVCSTDLLHEAVLAGLPLEGEQRAQLVFAEAGGIVQFMAGGRQSVTEAGRAVASFEVTGEALHQGEELRPGDFRRSDARRVGNACVSTCRSGWAPQH